MRFHKRARVLTAAFLATAIALMAGGTTRAAVIGEGRSFGLTVSRGAGPVGSSEEANQCFPWRVDWADVRPGIDDKGVQADMEQRPVPHGGWGEWSRWGIEASDGTAGFVWYFGVNETGGGRTGSGTVMPRAFSYVLRLSMSDDSSFDEKPSATSEVSFARQYWADRSGLSESDRKLMDRPNEFVASGLYGNLIPVYTPQSLQSDMSPLPWNQDALGSVLIGPLVEIREMVRDPASFIRGLMGEMGLAVPEPTTVVLLALGGLLGSVVRRRQWVRN